MGQSDKSMVREYIERVEGVIGTSFEMEIDGKARKRTLVVEVDFDLDPSVAGYSREKIGEIESTFSTIIQEERSDISSKFKLVSRVRHSNNKNSDASASRSTNPTQNTLSNTRQPTN